MLNTPEVNNVVLALLVPSILGMVAWAWSLAARLSVLEVTQTFLLEQRVEFRELITVITIMDKRLALVEDFIMNKKKER